MAAVSGTCVDCGGATATVYGGRVPPARCWECRKAYEHETRPWTPGRVLASIWLFAARYGVKPSAVDFNPTLARRIGHPERAARFHRDGDYPWQASVIREFGSWNAALAAAGFVPREVGQRG